MRTEKSSEIRRFSSRSSVQFAVSELRTSGESLDFSRCFLLDVEEVERDGEGGTFWEFSTRGEEGKESEFGESLPTLPSIGCEVTGELVGMSRRALLRE